MSRPTTVSVIIPTMAVTDRALHLRRAIESIRRSSTTTVKIITVVNGTRADSEICRWLATQPDIQYERLPTPSLPLAIQRGRELVQTPFFSFLDDDDEYLVGGTDLKLDAFSRHADVDLVITSGFRCCDGEVDHPIMTALANVPESPLQKLFESNWLSSCNALFRSESFLPEFFSDPHPYAEWTWLAYKLAMAGKKLAVVNRPTFRINDTPGSLSKTDAYHDAYQELYRRMLALAPPTDVARTVRSLISADWHDQSVRALSRGDKLDAFKFHFNSLMLPSGLQYLSYTRRLMPFWPNS